MKGFVFNWKIAGCKVAQDKLNCVRLKIPGLLQNSFFEGLPSSLTHIALQSNRISAIGPQCFTAFPNLRILQLYGNGIQNISRTAFHRLSHVEGVYV
eukprot:g58132.t1